MKRGLKNCEKRLLRFQLGAAQTICIDILPRHSEVPKHREAAPRIIMAASV
jgi:hypothetical protein